MRAIQVITFGDAKNHFLHTRRTLLTCTIMRKYGAGYETSADFTNCIGIFRRCFMD